MKHDQPATTAGYQPTVSDRIAFQPPASAVPNALNLSTHPMAVSAGNLNGPAAAAASIYGRLAINHGSASA